MREHAASHNAPFPEHVKHILADLDSEKIKPEDVMPKKEGEPKKDAEKKDDVANIDGPASPTNPPEVQPPTPTGTSSARPEDPITFDLEEEGADYSKKAKKRRRSSLFTEITE